MVKSVPEGWHSLTPRIVTHLRIGYAVTTLPAVSYSALQVWIGIASRRRSG